MSSRLDTSMSKINIIMPVFNGELYLYDSIKSILNQTFKDWELIIVNDGSTDNSEKIIKSFNDQRIKYFYKLNGGQASARNFGLKHAKDEFITFIDCDDYWDINFLSTQLIYINKGFDLVFCNGYIINKNFEKISDLNPGYGEYFGYKGFVKLINGTFFIPTSSVLLRRKLVYSVGLFDEEKKFQNAEDFALWLKLFLIGMKAYCHNNKLIYYRIHDNQVSKSDLSNQKTVLYVLLNILKNHEFLIDVYLAIISRLCTINLTLNKFFFKTFLLEFKNTSPFILDKLIFKYFNLNIFYFFLKIKFKLFKKFIFLKIKFKTLKIIKC
jgi:glycosyltransferase involved in cell wall biosynthesis